MGRPTISVNILPWEQAQSQAYPIRLAVFVKEQGVPEELELDEEDPLAWHAIAKLDGQAIGTARLQKDGKIGRMAVTRSCRRQGAASSLLKALIDFGSQQGIRQFYLHAQMEAIAFYENFGFTASGPIFREAGIAHQAMTKTI